MKRTKDEAEETKNRILSAGLCVFSRKGYAATTLIDIAAEAGVTRGALYWHFKDKQELYWKLNEKYNILFFGKINDILLENMNAVDKLKTIAVYIFSMLEDDEKFRMLEEINHHKFLAIGEAEAVCEYFMNQKDYKLNAVKTIIEEGVSEGIIRKDIDCVSIAISIVGYVFGLEQLWLHDINAFSIKARGMEFITILIDGIKEKGN